MFTFPLWGFILLWTTGVVAGGLVTYLCGPRRTVEVDRTEEDRPLNVFDAYSDDELRMLRQDAARLVKQYRKHGSTYSTNEATKELRKIDDEIQAREKAKLELEESKLTQIERDIAIFDAAYDHILKTPKENK